MQNLTGYLQFLYIPLSVNIDTFYCRNIDVSDSMIPGAASMWFSLHIK